MPGPTRRRRSLYGALAAVVALLAAGCGGGAAPASKAPAAGSEGAFPVTVQHRFGSTTIPAKPVRVVTLGYTDQDAVLALGTVPVATSEWYGNQPGALFPWAAAKLGGAPLPTVIPSSDAVQFEKIAALKPDLILSLYGGLEQGDYDKLSAIAPTIAQPAGVQNYAIPWDTQVEVVGRALGRPAEAAALVEGVRAKIAQVKAVGIPTPNANLFLPGSLKLTGPEAATPEQQMAYVTKAFTRLERLGVKILCFGSGGARRVPDGFSKDEAFAQLVAFGKRIAPEAKAHGITVVIEPLRQQETNIINSAAEGLTIGRASRVLPKDLKPAEILFRLGSIPTSFRPGSKRK